MPLKILPLSSAPFPFSANALKPTTDGIPATRFPPSGINCRSVFSGLLTRIGMVIVCLRSRGSVATMEIFFTSAFSGRVKLTSSFPSISVCTLSRNNILFLSRTRSSSSCNPSAFLSNWLNCIDSCKLSFPAFGVRIGSKFTSQFWAVLPLT